MLGQRAHLERPEAPDFKRKFTLNARVTFSRRARKFDSPSGDIEFLSITSRQLHHDKRDDELGARLDPLVMHG